MVIIYNEILSFDMNKTLKFKNNLNFMEGFLKTLTSQTSGMFFQVKLCNELSEWLKLRTHCLDLFESSICCGFSESWPNRQWFGRSWNHSTRISRFHHQCTRNLRVAIVWLLPEHNLVRVGSHCGWFMFYIEFFLPRIKETHL